MLSCNRPGPRRLIHLRRWGLSVREPPSFDYALPDLGTIPKLWTSGRRGFPIPATILDILPPHGASDCTTDNQHPPVLMTNVTGGVVGDYAPEWLGGTPKGVPPRPGTPEYDAFTKKQEAEANRDKSKDPPKPKAETPKLTQ